MLLLRNGRRICYDLVGNETGEVVAFSHALAADLGSWAEQVPPVLSASYRTLRIDMRGHGGSTALPTPYTIDALADDVIVVLDALRIDHCHFVGLSIGGMIGQSLGIRFGNRMASLMLCDTHPHSPPDSATFWAPKIEAVMQASSLETIADDTVARWLTTDYRRNHPGRWQQIRDTVAACTPTGYVGCVQAISSFDFSAQLRTIKSPTLVVCGTEDPRATPAESRRMASAIPGASYNEFAGARHLPNIEQPHAFNRVLLDWLAGKSRQH